MFKSFLFWLVASVVGMLVQLLTALGVPVWDFLYLYTPVGNLAPIINGVCWAIDFPTLSSILSVTVAALIAYTVTVFYLNWIRGFVASSNLMAIFSRLKEGMTVLLTTLLAGRFGA